MTRVDLDRNDHGRFQHSRVTRPIGQHQLFHEVEEKLGKHDRGFASSIRAWLQNSWSDHMCQNDPEYSGRSIDTPILEIMNKSHDLMLGDRKMIREIAGAFDIPNIQT